MEIPSAVTPEKYFETRYRSIHVPSPQRNTSKRGIDRWLECEHSGSDGDNSPEESVDSSSIQCECVLIATQFFLGRMHTTHIMGLPSLCGLQNTFQNYMHIAAIISRRILNQEAQ